MENLFAIPEDIGALSAEELESFIAETRSRIEEVTSAPAEFVSDDRTSAQLLVEVRSAAEALQSAREALAALEATDVEVEDELTADELQAELAEIATLAADGDDEEEVEAAAASDEDAGDADAGDDEGDEAIEASATPAVRKPAARRRPLPRPSRERQPAAHQQETVAMTASALAPGFEPGDEFPDSIALAKAMLDRKRSWGVIPGGTSGEKVTIAKADWSHLYGDDRRLTGDMVGDMALVAAALDPRSIRAEFDRRLKQSLTASGGLCAPVTPYYQLQMLSQASRPVRGALPAFNAVRGGIRFARPAALTVIDDAVGSKTMEEDAAGGTIALKGCQVIECPDWEEVDIVAIYHCLQYGNVGARVFPELLAQWNDLTMAAQARFAESALLTGIDTASTQVTAGDLGLGASAALPNQIMVAAEGFRNRHRMNPEAVLRAMLPDWAVPLMVSDVIRNEFQRFDTDEARLVALLRSFGVEPTFYQDSADTRAQVFGAQGTAALLNYPSHVQWYLYPEGSFLFVDGGSLELGLVRDSILNSTNDFQLFGETFENVAFIGIESLSVRSAVSDTGALSALHTVTNPVTY